VASARGPSVSWWAPAFGGLRAVQAYAACPVHVVCLGPAQLPPVPADCFTSGDCRPRARSKIAKPVRTIRCGGIALRVPHVEMTGSTRGRRRVHTDVRGVRLT